MAVGNGLRIIPSDMASLALAANQVSGTARLVQDVSPMYDNGSTPYGNGQAMHIRVVTASRGTGYKIGDVLTGVANLTPSGTANLFEVEVVAVDASGGLLGIRQIQTMPQGYYATAPTSPASLTGGSGSGAVATFDYFQIGPESAYSFPDYAVNFGEVTAFLIAAGGVNYQVGDSLNPGGGNIAVVSSVNGSGAVTGLTPALYAFGGLQSNLQLISPTGGHGSGCQLTAVYTIPQMPAWATELGRLRTNLSPYLSAMQYSASETAISGPWPISGPAWSNHDQWFWYEDTGGTVTLTVSCSFTGESSGQFNTKVIAVDIQELWYGNGWAVTSPPYAYGWAPNRQTPKPRIVQGIWEYNGGATPPDYYPQPGTYYDCLYCTNKNFDIVIGGSQAVTLTGYFYIFLAVIVGQSVAVHSHGSSLTGNLTNTTTTTPDPTNPISLIMVDPTSNFPGSISMYYVNGGGSGNPNYVAVVAYVNQTVNPGRYSLRLQFNTKGNDFYGGTNFLGSKIDTDPSSPTYNQEVADFSTADELYTNTTQTRISVFTAGSGFGIMQSAAVLTFSGPVAGLYSISAKSGHASISTVYSTAVAANGIDGVKNLYKINLPDSALNNVGGSLPSGIYAVNDLMIDPPGTVDITPTTGQFPYNAPTASGSGFYTPESAWQWWPFPQPNFNVEQIALAGVWSVTPSTTGFWTGITQAVSNLNIVTVDLMPWNFARLKNITGSGSNATFAENPMLLGGENVDGLAPCNSYSQTTPCEEQLEPPSWAALTYFTMGFTIVDSTGTGLFQCSTSGYSGPAVPTWVYKVGTVITESGTLPGTFHGGYAKWTCIHVLKPGNSITPAQHRARPIPRYPVYWYSETNPALKPPSGSLEATKTIWGCGNQWQDSTYLTSAGSVTQHGFQSGNLAKGWWIYSVSINRIAYGPATPVVGGAATGIGAGATNVGAGDTGSGAGGGAAVPSGGGDSAAGEAVTIGCIRSGVFVAFGTYGTGQTIQVLWPVFTSDALVYQCSERVDIQAVAINQYVSTGLGAVSQPIAAAFISDTELLLELVQ